MENKEQQKFQETKLKTQLIDKRLSMADLYRMIKEEFPDEPMSYDSILHIVSGDRDNYHIRTVLRICKVLNLTPNDIIEY